MPRHGDETFSELARHVQAPDLSGEDDDTLIARAKERVASRLTIAVETGMILAELMDREWSAVKIEREVGLHRRSVARWAEPFRREAG